MKNKGALWGVEDVAPYGVYPNLVRVRRAGPWSCREVTHKTKTAGAEPPPYGVGLVLCRLREIKLGFGNGEIIGAVGKNEGGGVDGVGE